MRSTLSLLSKLIALLVAFVLGFVSFGVALVGAGYLIFTKVSLDQLEELGVVDVDTSEILDDNAEVPVTSLTLAGLFGEMQTLMAMKDEVSITLLSTRYGLLIEDDLDPYLSKEYRDMPFTQLFSKETVDKIMNETVVGDVLGYEKVNNPDYNPEDPDAAAEYIWLNNGTKLTGITAMLAGYTIKEVTEISPDSLIDNLVIADILGLTKQENLTVYIVTDGVRAEVTDMTPIDMWCDEAGAPADGIINALAGFGLDDIQYNLDTLRIADITGLVEYNGNWYRWQYLPGESAIELTLESDITTELAHVTIAQVSSGELQGEIENVEISAFLGYTKDGDTWMQNGVPVEGIMATIADYKVGELDSEIGNIQVGELAGYVYNSDSGEWEVKGENGEMSPATGILAALADLTVDEMTNESELSGKVQSVTVADAMGFYIDTDGKVYTSKDKSEQVTGFMAVIAGEEIGSIEDSINTSKMGDMLGYTYNEGDDWWYDADGNPVPVMMNSIAAKTFDNVDTLASDLALSDVIPAENLETGFLQLLDPDTKIDSIGEEVNDTFSDATMTELMDAGIISISCAEDLDFTIGHGWRDQKLVYAFDNVISALVNMQWCYSIHVLDADGNAMENYRVELSGSSGNSKMGITDKHGTAVVLVDKLSDNTDPTSVVIWNLSCVEKLTVTENGAITGTQVIPEADYDVDYDLNEKIITITLH